MKKIAILGATGSIGTQTLDVVEKNPESLQVVALAAHKNVDLLEKQIRKFQPLVASLSDPAAAEELRKRVTGKTEIVSGTEGALACATCAEADTVVGAMVGYAGLKPTLSAIAAGKHIALANKESLVAAGGLVMQAVKEHGVQLTPVDSEHSAIFQCLQGNAHKNIKRILLTASGGPFFGMRRNELAQVTVERCLKHPTWHMGAKVTLDSSTLANKGLEVIEAHWLFDVPYEKITPIIHPQSIVHSLVEYTDGAVIAQMGVPDMKIPIQYALLYPERLPCPTKHLSLTDYGTLTFEKPDMETFSCLKTAIAAITTGGTAPCIVNGANEVAVAAFLSGKIRFLDIGALAQKAMEMIPATKIETYEDVMRADTKAREFVRNTIA